MWIELSISLLLCYRNPRLLIYKFPLLKTAAEMEREKDLLASQQVISVKQQSRVNKVTHDLVQWGAQLVSVRVHIPTHSLLLIKLLCLDFVVHFVLIITGRD